MTKRKTVTKSSNGTEKKVIEKVEVEKTYTTTTGVVLNLLPVSQTLVQKVLVNVRKKYEDDGSITPPTYEVETTGGGEQTFDHDETTLESDEDKNAWKAYNEALLEMQVEERVISSRVTLRRGIDLQLPDNNEWVTEQEELGIDVPEGNLDRFIHYIETEILITPDDIMGCMGRIMALSLEGVNLKEVGDIENMFRPIVEGIPTEDLDDKEAEPIE